MTTAILTPRELVAFARQLGNIADEIMRRKNKAARFVTDSRAVWKDAKYDRFYKAFDQTVSELNRFARRADDYSHFLEQKAGLAQKYLDSR